MCIKGRATPWVSCAPTILRPERAAETFSLLLFGDAKERNYIGDRI